jgi:hypothetical protein
MCHEYWMRRRAQEEAHDSRELWRDFERTRPLVDEDPPPDEREPVVELREEPAVRER